MNLNWRGFYTLFAKEVWRFLKVITQTVLTPVITALLYLLVFQTVLEDHVAVYPGISYTAFLVPGLITMSMIQNAFANSSSSLIQSKMNGNLIFVLVAPLSPLEFFLAFTAAAVLRGLLVGLAVWGVALLWVELPLVHPAWVLVFAVLGSAILGILGLIAGIWADKYDQLAAFQNFLILPLSFLSGVFYSIHDLPPFWEGLSWFNPFFYMIDGVRYGFLGASDSDPWLALTVVGATCLLLGAGCLRLLSQGYKIRA